MLVPYNLISVLNVIFHESIMQIITSCLNNPTYKNDFVKFGNFILTRVDGALLETITLFNKIQYTFWDDILCQEISDIHINPNIDKSAKYIEFPETVNKFINSTNNWTQYLSPTNVMKIKQLTQLT